MTPSDIGGLIVGGVILAFMAFVFGTIVWTMVKTMRRNADDDASPVLVLPARVVAKRTNVSGSGEGPTGTAYFATFEFVRGERREYALRGDEYGLLAEGDAGELTAQGSRFRGFRRGVE